MKDLLPFFPLNVVIFPNQKLNLHVFEPRYKELLKDCLDNNSNFCIPSYVMNKIEYGTEMQLLEVDKWYNDGRADIKTIGKRVVKINSMNNPYQDKQYAMGEVSYIENIDNGDVLLRQKIKESLNTLFDLMEVKPIKVADDFDVFSIAHKIGLSKESEYELLKLTEERKRQRFLLDHLKVIIPKLMDLQNAKAKIKMNGHFRRYDPLEF